MEHLDLGCYFVRTALKATLVSGSHKSSEQGMRLKWLRFELRVELAADEMRMIGQFDHLHVGTVRRRTRNAQARRVECLFIFTVELVAVAMALADFGLAINSVGQGIGLDFAGPGS